jgi:hypothetical protein
MEEYIVRSHPGRTEYYNMKGQLHRLNGPAVEFTYGSKEYWVNGQMYTEEEFNRLIGNRLSVKDELIVLLEKALSILKEA